MADEGERKLRTLRRPSGDGLPVPAPRASAMPRSASEDDPTPVEAMRLDALPVSESRAEDDRTPVEEPPPAILRAAATPLRGSARPGAAPRPPKPSALPGVSSPGRSVTPPVYGVPTQSAAMTPTPRALPTVPAPAVPVARSAAASAGFPVAPLGSGATPTPTPTASAGAPVALAPTGSAGSWRPLPGSGPAILPPPVMSAPPPSPPSRWPFVAGVVLLLGSGGALAAWRFTQQPVSVPVVAPVHSTPGVVTEPASPRPANPADTVAEPKPNARIGKAETRAEGRAASKTAGGLEDGVAPADVPGEGASEAAGRTRRAASGRLAYREQEREPARPEDDRAASASSPSALPAPTPEEPSSGPRPAEATGNQENKADEAALPAGPPVTAVVSPPPTPSRLTAPAEPPAHEAATGKEPSPRRPVEPAVAVQPPKALSTQAARQQLLIDPNDEQYKVKLTPALERAGMNFWAVLKICVSPQGNVTDVKIVRPADPAIDAQFPALIGKWKYRPYLVDGRPTAFCYLLRYEIDTR